MLQTAVAVSSGKPISKPVRKTRPVLFTPEVLRQIPGWVKQGLSLETMAQRIGCTPGSLKTTCSNHKISLERNIAERVVFHDPLVTTKITVSSECMITLRQEARRRGLTVYELTAAILEAVAEDDLFNAVLEE